MFVFLQGMPPESVVLHVVTGHSTTGKKVNRIYGLSLSAIGRYFTKSLTH